MAAAIKATYNGTEFSVKLTGFDARSKTTKALVNNVKTALELAANKLVLRRNIVIELRNVEVFYTADAEGLTRVRGCYDTKKNVTIGAARSWEKVQHTLLHELGHVEHETKFPGSCVSWEWLERETYAENVAESFGSVRS